MKEYDINDRGLGCALYALSEANMLIASVNHDVWAGGNHLGEHEKQQQLIRAQKIITDALTKILED